MEEKNEILGPVESFAVGGGVGFAQTLVSLPFWTMKMRMQCKLPMSLNPMVLYTGFWPAAASISLMSNSQVFFTTAAHRFFNRWQNKEEVSFEEDHFAMRAASAASGGLVATIIANPVGVIITQQHKHKGTTFKAMGLHMMKTHGLRSFYPSFACNWVINSAFTLSFYAVYPFLHRQFTDHYQSELRSQLSANALLALTAIPLQPLDTIKTIQEHRADEKKISIKGIMGEIYKTSRCRGFFVGVGPAVLSTGTALAVASVVVNEAENYFAKP